ncbi:MAG TPA: FG-GAP-like repeat-containing protein, partial [Candidatus Polarisedimenticolaceae bacterium]|nr:FG-GAP-like repeat-containing protein [Candidatus Polarisedimenticolaceae bacterium]
ADGLVRIVRWAKDGLRVLRAPLDESARIGPAGRRLRETVVRAAAAGDLGGDGRKRVVVASKDGRVYVFDGDGRRVPGFPVSIDPDLAEPTGPEQVIEHGILSRPVLVDLDGKPGLEILVSALDGHLYAWRHDGKPLDGFPVAVHPAGERASHRAKIVSTPAVGDIDGDGALEIVVGSNHVHDGRAGVYAVRARGNAQPGGAFLAGWRPFPVDGVRPDLLPTVARGLQMDPVLVDADDDGDDEVFVYAVTGNRIKLIDQPADGPPRVSAEFSLSPGTRSVFRDTAFLGGTGSPALIDADADGTPELYAPLLPMRMITLRFKPGVPIDVPTVLGGWPLVASADHSAPVEMLPDYPRRMEDLMLLVRPAFADVDGDGKPEVLVGSGGYLLHAFAAGGGEAPGFPKFTGGWLFSDAAVGDLDGDGVSELVSVTREGYLFAWQLAAAARPASDR